MVKAKEKTAGQDKIEDKVEWRVKSGGKDVTDKFDLISCNVSQRVNKIACATLILQDGLRDKQNFEASSSPYFRPGAKIELTVAYNTAQQKKIFEGIVINHSINVRKGKPTMLIVELKDEAVKMTIVRRNKIFVGTDTDIIKQIINYGDNKAKNPSGNLASANIDAGTSDTGGSTSNADESRKRYNVSVEIDNDSATSHYELVQYNVTDWDFVVSRADALGKLVYNLNGTLQIKDPVIKEKGTKVSNDSTENTDEKAGGLLSSKKIDAGKAISFGAGVSGSLLAATGTAAGTLASNGLDVVAIIAPVLGKSIVSDVPVITFGDNLFEIEGGVDARHQYSSVEALSWDYASQENGLAEGKDSNNKFQEAGSMNSSDLSKVVNDEPYKLYQSGRVDGDELKAWANAKMQRSRLSRIRGRVKFQGRIDVVPGGTIELAGVGDMFNGRVFVAGVSHELGKGDWITDVEFGLSHDWFVNEVEQVLDTPVSGLIPSMEGLHIGIVKTLVGDPAGQGRIQVSVPIINDEDGSIWARVAKEFAGKTQVGGNEVNYGFHIGPEVGEEVILGFVNNDPRNAIVIGSLHSEQKASPFKNDDNNYEKGLITKSGLKMIFNDEKKSFLLQTKEGYMLEISEDAKRIYVTDKHKNELTLNEKGISIKSDKKITLDGKEGIELTSSNGDVKVKGGNINIESTKGLKIKSNGVAEIKGKTIKLN